MKDFDHKLGAIPGFGSYVNLGAVGLYDLVDNCQTQTGAPFKLRLKRLKNLFDKLPRDSRTSVSNSNAPGVSRRLHRNGDGPILTNRCNGVGQQVPENLLDAVCV